MPSFSFAASTTTALLQEMPRGAIGTDPDLCGRLSAGSGAGVGTGVGVGVGFEAHAVARRRTMASKRMEKS
jgi:hypothetical protein